MEQKRFLRIALPTPLRRLFDYLPPQPVDLKVLIPGIRVRVPFQSRILVGILIDVVQESSVPYEKLKRVVELIDSAPLLPADLYQLCLWAADYYHYSWGEVLSNALPALLRLGKPLQTKASKTVVMQSNESPLLLNAAQQQAVSAICATKNTFNVFLLDGITGSGKTEVYLHVIDSVLREDKQILVLIPEISLTPQTITRFRARFPVPVVALHSSMSQHERLRAWLDAKSGDAKIIIGTRSAVFTPFATLGLIIVDEEHDISFKQQDRFRYHARDLAIVRAHSHRVPIVLGSATPSLESLLNVKRERYHYLSLPKRAGVAELPQYHIIDLRSSSVEEGLSITLLEAIKEHLERHHQVLLFLNRRGFAPVLYCTHCAWIANCERCDTRMVYHRAPLRLQCHRCDKQSHPPTCCVKCGHAALQPIGLGTQRLEQTLAKHFPDVPIIRVDRDNTKRKGAMQDLLLKIKEEEKAILLGTQMLAKGHHFPQVTLVGIIDADNGLFSADFRAAEQMGQLLLQVAGRAGRAEKPGTVMIQTHYPDHPLLHTLIYEGYQSFSQLLLREREQAVLPPFSYLAIFRAEAYEIQQADQFLLTIKNKMSSSMNAMTILGPVPALIAKRKGLHCRQLWISAKYRRDLQHFLKNNLQQIEKIALQQAVKWTLDVDPLEV